MERADAAATWKSLGIGCVVWLFFFVPLSGFMFDAPGSEQSVPTWFLASSIWAYPILHLMAVLLSQTALANKEPLWKVRLLAYAPLLSVVWLIAGIIWIELRCDGKFVCR